MSYKKAVLWGTQNDYQILRNKEVIFSIFHNTDNNFDEITISLAQQIFHAIEFEHELKMLSDFVSQCLQCSTSIKFALCSYEINSYLLGDIKNLADITSQVLAKFPIVYVSKKNAPPEVVIKHSAQDLFTSHDAITFEDN